MWMFLVFMKCFFYDKKFVSSLHSLSITFASDLPWGPGRPPHRSAAHQRTSTHEQIVDKARLLMGKTACNTHASPPGSYWRTALLCGRWGSCAFLPVNVEHCFRHIRRRSAGKVLYIASCQATRAFQSAEAK